MRASLSVATGFVTNHLEKKLKIAPRIVRQYVEMDIAIVLVTNRPAIVPKTVRQSLLIVAMVFVKTVLARRRLPVPLIAVTYVVRGGTVPTLASRPVAAVLTRGNALVELALE